MGKYLKDPLSIDFFKANMNTGAISSMSKIGMLLRWMLRLLTIDIILSDTINKLRNKYSIESSNGLDLSGLWKSATIPLPCQTSLLINSLIFLGYPW